MSSGAVILAKRVIIGAQSVVMPESTLQDRAVLGALSIAPRGAILESDCVYVGAPIPVKVKGSQFRPRNEKAKLSAKVTPTIQEY